MDKRLAKLVFREAGIEVAPHTLIHREEFTRERDSAIERAHSEQGTPCYVKPATLGSSIGVGRATSREELEEALELCFELDRTALVEPALDDFLEVNVAILGSRGTELRASASSSPSATRRPRSRSRTSTCAAAARAAASRRAAAAAARRAAPPRAWRAPTA